MYMRRSTTIIGALGAALAGYVLGNASLRRELKQSKDPQDAAKRIGKHLRRDSAEVIQPVRDRVEEGWDDARGYMQRKMDSVRGTVDHSMDEVKDKADAMKRKVDNASKNAERAVQKREAERKMEKE